VFGRVAPSRSPAHDAEAAVVFDGGRTSSGGVGGAGTGMARRSGLASNVVGPGSATPSRPCC